MTGKTLQLARLAVFGAACALLIGGIAMQACAEGLTLYVSPLGNDA